MKRLLDKKYQASDHKLAKIEGTDIGIYAH